MTKADMTTDPQTRPIDDLTVQIADPRVQRVLFKPTDEIASQSLYVKIKGRLIRGKYHDGTGRLGCPLYFLTGVRSNTELLAHDFGCE